MTLVSDSSSHGQGALFSFLIDSITSSHLSLAFPPLKRIRIFDELHGDRPAKRVQTELGRIRIGLGVLGRPQHLECTQKSTALYGLAGSAFHEFISTSIKMENGLLVAGFPLRSFL